MKVTLLIPTLNEVDGMKEIMPQIKREWIDQIIILDGGSTDGTVEWARENGYFVYIQKEVGLRLGYCEVFDYIEGDYMITFSPDGNSIPDRIPALVDKLKEGYDMVVVSRYLDDATSDDDTLLTAFGNWMFTTIINVLFGGKYSDAMGIYRGYKKEVISKLKINSRNHSPLWEKHIGTGVSFEPLISIRCAKYKLKIAEIPGSEPKRIYGTRKMKPFRWGSAILFQIAQELFKSKNLNKLK